MNTSKLWVSLMAFIALFAVMSIASAQEFASITSVTVNGIEQFNGNSSVAAVFAGETIPVRVIFYANDNASDVRVVARISGESGFSENTERFDVVSGGTYSRLVNVKLPYRIDPNERFDLEISVESRNKGIADTRTIPLEVQRASYEVQVLSVETPAEAKAGKSLPLDIVIKNRGRQFSEDTYVTARIPQLGVTSTAYFGDLSPVDQGGNIVDKEDAVERRMFLQIPASAPAGVYTIEVQAYNPDTSTVVTKKVVINSGLGENSVVSSGTTKVFAVGETATYRLNLVNAGDTIKVYELAIDSPTGLTVTTDDTVVVVPAGSSRTVTLAATAKKEGAYVFTVDVTSENALVKSETFAAQVQGTANVSATVVLTVILAIIFVVLVVVLIVLLTRRPEKKEEFGESYY